MIESRTFQLPGRAVALVLAGGRGSRLHELTDRRAKPAVYFGGKYRIVDFAMSNCVNSGIRRVGVVTQYKSHSLLRHLQRGWGFLRGEVNEFVDLLPAQQRVDEESWYRGTADAVYQNIDIISDYQPAPQYVVILAGDHVYKMNYAAMLVDHVESGAECTVACIEVPRKDASGFGVMAVDAGRKITDFVEKPADPPAMVGKPDSSLCSMGIYIFNAAYLYSELERDITDPTSSHDFGKDIIPTMLNDNRTLYAYKFEGYWKDVGTIDSLWEANMDLLSSKNELDLGDPSWKIYTEDVTALPQYISAEADIKDAYITQGCVVQGEVKHSVLFTGVKIGAGARIIDSVLMPGVVVEEGVVVQRALVADGVRIGKGAVVGAADSDHIELVAKRVKGAE